MPPGRAATSSPSGPPVGASAITEPSHPGRFGKGSVHPEVMFGFGARLITSTRPSDPPMANTGPGRVCVATPRSRQTTAEQAQRTNTSGSLSRGGQCIRKLACVVGGASAADASEANLEERVAGTPGSKTSAPGDKPPSLTGRAPQARTSGSLAVSTTTRAEYPRPRHGGVTSSCSTPAPFE